MADRLAHHFALIGDPDDVPDAFFSALATLLLHAGDSLEDFEVRELERPEEIETRPVALREKAS